MINDPQSLQTGLTLRPLNDLEIRQFWPNSMVNKCVLMEIDLNQTVFKAYVFTGR